MTTINTYYKKIIDLILDVQHEEFSNAVSGHCMKITGLGMDELDYLWAIIAVKYPEIDTYIVIEGQTSSNKYISATKLIELRNKQEKPLLVLIPSNSRTAAEDSYGNATFKDISLEGIEMQLKEQLVSEIPAEFKRVIQEEILHYLRAENIGISAIINYLIQLNEQGFNKKNIGDFMYYLGCLMPDSDLLNREDKIRARLNYNLLSIKLLSSFNKPLYDKIGELPLKNNTLQKALVAFIKSEKAAKSAEALCLAIAEKYPQLNFAHWDIPDLGSEDIKSHQTISKNKTVLKCSMLNWVNRLKLKSDLAPREVPKTLQNLNFSKSF
jgi:DNA phosphorothioation-dependent restriction protein DptH